MGQSKELIVLALRKTGIDKVVELRSRLKPRMTLDFTPLVDIIFILLIFFILSYNQAKTRGYRVELAGGQQGNVVIDPKSDPIIISVDRDSILMKDRTRKVRIQMKEIDQLNQVLKTWVKEWQEKHKSLDRDEPGKNKTPEVIVNAEEDLELWVILKLFDQIKLANIQKTPYLHSKKRSARRKGQ
ncbi:MAG TPA: hypothetical protein ENI73_01985 [Spirochaetes bacterium]|nr:hypothetical protein [Spirochaetota bacterium]